MPEAILGERLKGLYDLLGKDYELGTEEDFRVNMNNPEIRKGMYNLLSEKYEVGSEKDFDSYVLPALVEQSKYTPPVDSTEQKITETAKGFVEKSAEHLQDYAPAASWEHLFSEAFAKAGTMGWGRTPATDPTLSKEMRTFAQQMLEKGREEHGKVPEVLGSIAGFGASMGLAGSSLGGGGKLASEFLLAGAQTTGQKLAKTAIAEAGLGIAYGGLEKLDSEESRLLAMGENAALFAGLGVAGQAIGMVGKRIFKSIGLLKETAKATLPEKPAIEEIMDVFAKDGKERANRLMDEYVRANKITTEEVIAIGNTMSDMEKAIKASEIGGGSDIEVEAQLRIIDALERQGMAREDVIATWEDINAGRITVREGLKRARTQGAIEKGEVYTREPQEIKPESSTQAEMLKQELRQEEAIAPPVSPSKIAEKVKKGAAKEVAKEESLVQSVLDTKGQAAIELTAKSPEEVSKLIEYTTKKWKSAKTIEEKMRYSQATDLLKQASGKAPAPESVAKAVEKAQAVEQPIPSVYMQMPIEEVQAQAKQGVKGAKDALKARNIMGTIDATGTKITLGKESGGVAVNQIMDEIKKVNITGDVGKQVDNILAKYNLKLTSEQRNFIIKQSQITKVVSGKIEIIKPKVAEAVRETAAKNIAADLKEVRELEVFDERIPLTKDLFSNPLHSKVVDAIGKYIIDNKVVWDKTVHDNLSDLMRELIYTGKIKFTDVQKYGVTLDQFSDLWRQGISLHASALADLSHLSRMMPKELKRGAEALGKATREPTIWNSAFSFMQRLDNIRRGLMVTQLATAMRNAISQTMNLGLNSMDESFAIALGKVMNKAGKPFGKDWAKAYENSGLLDGFKVISKLSNKNKKIVEEILKRFPKERDLLLSHYSSDVSVGTNVGKILKYGEKATTWLNFANRFQEFTIRRAAFIGKLNELMSRRGINYVDLFDKARNLENQYLKKYGIDWRSLIQKDEALLYKNIFQQIGKKDVVEATKYALDMTFANSPKYGSIAHKAIGIVNQLPFLGTGIMPFPRFMYNAMMFNFQHSPLGFFRLLSKGANAPEVIAKAATGSTLFLAAWQLRNSEYAGEKWYQVKVGDRYYDTRPYNPFAMYLFVADIFKRWSDGTLGKMTTADYISGIFSTNLRAGVGLYMLDQIAKGLAEPSQIDKAGKVGMGYVGELLSSFTVPSRQVIDFLADFDEKYAVMRETKLDPFWGRSMANIPGLALRLPEAEAPTREANYKREFSIARQLTGVISVGTKNILEKELDRLDFKFYEIFRTYGDAKLDLAVKKYMGEYVEREVLKELSGKEYRQASDYEKGEMLREILMEARRYGLEEAIDSSQELDDIYFNIQEQRRPWRERRAEEEREGLR